jgi:hypothetical protein
VHVQIEAQRSSPWGNHSYFSKDVILFAESAYFFRQEKIAPFPAADVGEILHVEYDETIEVFVREGIDKNAVDNTEHYGGSADAESEGENGDDGETAICDKSAQPNAEIAEERPQYESQVDRDALEVNHVYPACRQYYRKAPAWLTEP